MLTSSLGIFTEHISWRWCFYINLPIGAVAAAIIVIFFHAPVEPEPATRREIFLQMDFPGTFILMAAIVCYLLAMQWAGTTRPWDDPSVIATLVMFGLLTIAFLALEYYQGDRALLSGRLLKDRTIMAMCAFIFVVAGAFFILLYYLPIYFQATLNVSAAKSGIDNLPLVLGTSLFSIVSGALLSGWGQYIPVMAVGTTILSVGCGLVYTLDADSPPSQWIGYQALVGIGVGLVLQIPVIVCQAISEPSDLSSISAIVLFFQTVGGAVWISAAQAGFANTMLKVLPREAPNLNPGLVLATGASDIRRVFSPEDVPGIIAAYMEGLRVPFAICIACACLTFVLSFSPRWENIKGKVKMDEGAG